MNPTIYLRETVDLVRQIESRFLELAQRLFNIKEKEIWKQDYDSFQDFLDTTKISKGNASMLMAIHKAYVVDGGMTHAKLAKAGYSNLYEAMPLIERDGVEKAAEIARTLTRSEIKDEVREEKHGECAHPEIIKICATCHKRVE